MKKQVNGPRTQNQLQLAAEPRGSRSQVPPQRPRKHLSIFPIPSTASRSNFCLPPQVYCVEMASRFLDGGVGGAMTQTNLLRTIHDFGLGGTKYKTDNLLNTGTRRSIIDD
ncbi:hypothetical protein E4U31_000623 [Claviceps sp. LM219 group G6]|nr:hypothetical protein E4U31_000623 [Claviceps sp. LM219 group G6]